MRHHLVLRVVSKILIPFILVFALYVQFHGDYGPGGGFQAGVLFGAAFILYALIFGLAPARRVFSSRMLAFLVPFGVLLFAGTGIASLLLGSQYLDYDPLLANPIAGQHLGIFLVELGVGITVAAVMVVVFFAYAGRSREIDDGEW
jgi:multicomponent Na+:H+ antiporter subunit B